MDHDDDGYRRHHPVLAAACIVLAIAVAGLAWYAYPRFQQQSASLNQLRDELHNRVQQIKDEATDSASVHDRLRSEADKLRQDLRARIDSASKKASQAAEDAYNRMEARLNARLNNEIEARTEGVGQLKDRMANLEASRSADQTQIAELKQQLNDVRAQTEQSASEQSNALDGLRQQVADNQSGASQQIATLQRESDQNRQDVAGISTKLAVEKIPFEASKDHQSELTGGISLYVSGTDITHRRVDGWMYVASEHRNLWLHQQSALEPVIFYGSHDGQKRELVITNVATNSVTGYLLLPKPNRPTPVPRAGAGGE